MSKKAVVVRDPEAVFGLDLHGTGRYEYRPFPAGFFRERLLVIDGLRCEVIGTDPDGCWLYRASAF